MNAVLTVAEIVAPVMILAGVGYAWVKLGYEYRIRFVTQLSMTLALPCLIFTALMKSPIDGAALAAVSAAALVAYGVVSVAFWVAVAVTGLDRRSYLAPLIFGNTGNLGLPLALFAFGDLGLGYAVVIFAVMAVLSFTVGIWLVSEGVPVLTVLREPVLVATVLGAVFLWQGWQTPGFLTNALELIGQIAIPLMLITLGVALARLKPARLTRMAWLSLFKAAVCVGVAWLVGRAFGLEDVAFAVLVLQLGTPVAVTSYLLAEKYGADSDAVAGLVVVSTLLSVALLPFLLGVLI